MSWLFWGGVFLAWWLGMAPAAYIVGNIVRKLKPDARPGDTVLVLVVVFWPVVLLASPAMTAFRWALAQKAKGDGKGK